VAVSSGFAINCSMTSFAQYSPLGPADLVQPKLETNPSKEYMPPIPPLSGTNDARFRSHQVRQSVMALLKSGPQGVWQNVSRA